MIRKCECHDEEMGWHKDARRAKGGYWYCKSLSRKNSANYRIRHPEKIKKQLKARYQNLEYKERKIAKLRSWEEEKRNDILWRLKQNTKKWQKNRKRGIYI